MTTQMTTRSSIQTALGFGDRLLSALADMKDQPLQRPGTWGGNHPMWIAGHLAVTEGRLHKILFGTPNPVEHWKPLFDWGTEPTDNLATYPPFDEVLATLCALRTKTTQFLESLDEAGLNRPTALPPPGLNGFETVGSALLIIALHNSLHNGEALVCRRASGQQPYFTPSAELRAF